jgi:hypothetical protein
MFDPTPQKPVRRASPREAPPGSQSAQNLDPFRTPQQAQGPGRRRRPEPVSNGALSVGPAPL